MSKLRKANSVRPPFARSQRRLVAPAVALVLIVCMSWSRDVAIGDGEGGAPRTSSAATRAQQQPPAQAPGEVGAAAPEVAAAEAPSIEGVERAELKVFGSDLFRRPPETFAPIPETPVPPTYILGPGDVLLVRYWSPLMETVEVEAEVTPEGTIFLPLAGELVMQGLSLEQAGAHLQEELSKYYTQVKVLVTLSKLRALQVFVAGEAARPGAYTMSALSTLFNALYFAGGPNSHGSMRDIRLVRQNNIVGRMDTYDYLLRGDRTEDYPLENGDTVFIPVVGPQVWVSGSVRRPAIYELKGGERFSDVIQMAGGTAAGAYLGRAQVARVLENRERVVLDVHLTKVLAEPGGQADLELKDGDFVTVLGVVDIEQNVVYVEGNVLRPGKYELKPGMRVADLIAEAEGLGLEEPFWDRAALFRTLPDGRVQILGFDLRLALQGEEENNLVLQRWDRIIIHTYDELRHVTEASLGELEASRSWPGAKTVCILGEVAKPGVYSIDTPTEHKLSALLETAGGLTSDAYPEGTIFLRSLERLVSREHLRTAEGVRSRMSSVARRYYEAELARLRLTGAEGGAGAPLGVFQGLPVGAIEGEGAEVVVAPAELPPVLSGRRVRIDLKQVIDTAGAKGDIALTDGDTIIVPSTPLTVIITGAVASPSSIAYTPGRQVESYVREAGGLTEDADLERAAIIRPSGALVAVTQDMEMEPGDILIVPAKVYIERPKTRSERRRETLQTAVNVATFAYIIYVLTK